MYSRDVKLTIADEDRVPWNRLLDISNNLRDVKLVKHGGRIPSKLLRPRSNSSSFFSAQKSVKSKKIVTVF